MFLEDSQWLTRELPALNLGCGMLQGVCQNGWLLNLTFSFYLALSKCLMESCIGLPSPHFKLNLFKTVPNSYLLSKLECWETDRIKAWKEWSRYQYLHMKVIIMPSWLYTFPRKDNNLYFPLCGSLRKEKKWSFAICLIIPLELLWSSALYMQ